MANISKIEVDGVTYDIEDTTARASSGGSGLTADVKQTLLACFQKVAWIDSNGQYYYDALEMALYPPANLVSISAVYTQSGSVYNTDELDVLRDDLVVTATYDDESTEIVTNYILEGELLRGVCPITVTYAGKTDTFDVNVTFIDSAVVYTLSNPVTFPSSPRTTVVNSGITLSPTESWTISGEFTDDALATSGKYRYMGSGDANVNVTVFRNSQNIVCAYHSGDTIAISSVNSVADGTKPFRFVMRHVADSNSADVHISYYSKADSTTIVTVDKTLTVTGTEASQRILFGGISIAAQSMIGTLSIAQIRRRAMLDSEITDFLNHVEE